MQVLADEPCCRQCASTGITKLATEVDHIKPLRFGGAPLDRENLQPLCHACHSAKTLAESRPSASAAPSGGQPGGAGKKLS